MASIGDLCDMEHHAAAAAAAAAAETDDIWMQREGRWSYLTDLDQHLGTWPYPATSVGDINTSCRQPVDIGLMPHLSFPSVALQ